jgi:two-component system, sensor histidine kinase SagS
MKQSSLYYTLTTVLSRKATTLAVSDQLPIIDHHQPSLRPARVLLPEDNLINQMVGLKLLRQLGYPADVVVDGNGVLEALSHTSYDVILMDLQGARNRPGGLG